MKRPNYLKENGTIYLVAPSYGCTTEPYFSRLLRAIKLFKKMDYNVIQAKSCFNMVGALSNTKEIVAQEFMMAYESDADIIMSVGGGELMVEVLPFIDFEKIKTLPPKWFVGYSDNTNLTYTLTTICGIETIYSHCAGDFYSKPFLPDVNDCYLLFTGNKKTFTGYPKWELNEIKSPTKPYAKYNLTEKKIIQKFGKIKPNFDGIMLGGCLDCLVGLSGTRFDNTLNFIENHKDEGIIWFLESCDLNVFGIRRAFHKLDELGWFKYTKGFLIGRPLSFGDNFNGLDQYTAVTGILNKYNVPIIMDIDLGHLKPMIPFITGAKATVTVLENDIEIEYEE